MTGQKRDRNNLVAVPEDLPENDLAPPVPAKRARTSRAVTFRFSVYVTNITNCLCDLPQQTSKVPDRAERPLQAPPKPTLTFTAKGSPYGFPTASGIHAPADPNRQPLASKTNAQASTVVNFNEVMIDPYLIFSSLLIDFFYLSEQ